MARIHAILILGFVSFAHASQPQETHVKMIKAIKNSDHAQLLTQFKAREAAVSNKSRLATILEDVESGVARAEAALPATSTVAVDVAEGAKVVGFVAGMAGDEPVAAAAGEVENVAAAYGTAAAAAQQVMALSAASSSAPAVSVPATSSTVLGLSPASQSTYLQEAVAIEKEAMASSGWKSRLLAGTVGVISIVYCGVKIWTDVFSTDNTTTNKKVAALTTDAGTITLSGSVGLGGLYYAITNKYNNDSQVQAQMTTRAVEHHESKMQKLD